MKYSGIGGQAVIEGIMMQNGDDYAIAVRKPDGEIPHPGPSFYPRRFQICRLYGGGDACFNLVLQLF